MTFSPEVLIGVLISIDLFLILFPIGCYFMAGGWPSKTDPPKIRAIAIFGSLFLGGMSLLGFFFLVQDLIMILGG